MTAIKVFMADPKHDDKVMDAAARAMAEADAKCLRSGVFIIDFADATVIGISEKVPPYELFHAERPMENSILAGGFGAATPYPWDEPWSPGNSIEDTMAEMFSADELRLIEDDTQELKEAREHG